MKHVRDEYYAQPLNQQDLNADPLAQAQQWVQEAIDADFPLPNAMSLATVDANGQPSNRIVLLKGVEQGGFTFFTDYDSQKGQDIAANDRVGFTMFWQPFDRQIVVKGRAEKLSDEVSTDYFHSRPYDSQVSAAISPQSHAVSREWLEEEVEKLKKDCPQGPVPKPQRWGGYRIVPSEIQFWHGRPSRLHDRFRYQKQADGNWVIERLAP